MTPNRRRPDIGLVIYFAFTFILGIYFTFASVQGNFGLLRRFEIDAEMRDLTGQFAALEREVQAQANRTRRLSDDYLDLDLLDEQAREILGFARTDEVILR